MAYSNRNPTLDARLKEIGLLHDRKNRDYSPENNPWGNFIISALMGCTSIQRVFSVLLGIKQSRLMVIGHRPSEDINFEAITDTLVDSANYRIIGTSFIDEYGIDMYRAEFDVEEIIPYLLAYLADKAKGRVRTEEELL